jgi:hypothetical protein
MKEKLMVKKTKVIAIRVTQDEYEALTIQAAGRKVSELVYDCLGGALDVGLSKLTQERKKAEAKAKRQAKKEAASGL